MLDREEGRQCDALAQGGSPGYRAVKAVEGSAAEQPKCEHLKRSLARRDHDSATTRFLSTPRFSASGTPRRAGARTKRKAFCLETTTRSSRNISVRLASVARASHCPAPSPPMNTAVGAVTQQFNIRDLGTLGGD